MFILVPMGVEDHRVDRLPWVSLVIAGLCVAAFLATQFSEFRNRFEDQGSQDVASYWLDHPYLTPPPALPARQIDARFTRALAARAAHARAPPESLVAEEQARLEALAEALIDARHHDPLYRFGLVPARGLFQAGWITHMFLHAGWLHLLGNLFFFYLVGPLLEDAWGRPLFLAFYLVGGIAAALAQFALDPASTIYMVGASGAIAACMGAFSFRFANRNIKLGYFLWYLRVARGTFQAPAWLCGAGWLATQLWSLWLGGQTGVALMAHIGGFGFGLAVAAALGATGVERRYVAPAVEKKVGWAPDAEVVQARAALAEGNPDSAAQAYRRLLNVQPDHRDALVGLAALEIAANRRTAAAPLVERAVRTALQRNPAQAWDVVAELGAAFHPEHLSPAVAFRLASSQSAAPDGLWTWIEPLWVAASSGGGTMGAKALLRAVQIRLELQEDPRQSLAYLERIRQIPEVPEELLRKAADLEAQVQRQAQQRPQIEEAPEG